MCLEFQGVYVVNDFPFSDGLIPKYLVTNTGFAITVKSNSRSKLSRRLTTMLNIRLSGIIEF